MKEMQKRIMGKEFKRSETLMNNRMMKRRKRNIKTIREGVNTEKEGYRTRIA